MAGALQAIILSPSYSTKPVSFPFMNRHLPPNSTLLFTRSVSSSRSRSISTTIKAYERPNQIGDGHGSKRSPSKDLNWGEWLLNFAGNNFLPLALVSGVALGFVNPSLGCLADRYSLSKFIAFGIFIISGLTLHNGDIGASMEVWPVGIFGLAWLYLVVCLPQYQVEWHLLILLEEILHLLLQ